MSDDWPEAHGGGQGGKSQVWDAGLQTDEEAYLSALENQLKSLQSRAEPSSGPSSPGQGSRPVPPTHHSSRSQDRIYLGSSTSPGGSIGSISDEEVDNSDVGIRDTMIEDSECPGRGKDVRQDESDDQLGGHRVSSALDSDRADDVEPGEEDDPGYPLLLRHEQESEAEYLADGLTSIISKGRDGPTSSPERSTVSRLSTENTFDKPLSHGSITPGHDSASPASSPLDSIPASPYNMSSRSHRTSDNADTPSPPFTPFDQTSPSWTPRSADSPSGTYSSPTRTLNGARSPAHPPSSKTRTITSPRRSPTTRLANALSPANPSPSASQPTPTKHINFAPRVRITSGIRVPTSGGSKPGSRVPSASSRVPSGSGTPTTTVPQPNPSASTHPQPIRQNTSTWNPLPDFGFGGRSIETASLASSVSVSLRTVPVNTWLFPNSIARALMGRRDSGGSAAIPSDLAAESASLLPGPPAMDVGAGDDLSADYFSINPHPGTTPTTRARGASTPGSGSMTPTLLVTPDLDAADSPSSRRSSVSFFSRTSTLPHHTQEEELIEAEAARRRADVMLFNTPYMRSYSSMIREEEAVSPDALGGTAGSSSSRNKGKGRIHTVIKIKSEEDVIWGEDRWTKWKNWKWWVWKGGKWWRAFENFWCAVDDDEEGDGWDY